MSFRDAHAMMECVFYVNGLPGGEAHHDGGMKGKDAAKVLGNPMLQLTGRRNRRAGSACGRKPPRVVVTEARPARGTAEPRADRCRCGRRRAARHRQARVRPRGLGGGVRGGARRSTRASCFFVSCDLNPSTKIGKAAALVPASHTFEMSIQEQAAALMANGLAFSSREPQINVFATFSAFFEGIAREGFEFWRYQRNLTGANEGLNVILHLSHVGTNTGRDHFSGWSLDWINLAIGYLPYLRRFYAPSDARSAFLAVRDAAAGMGGHIVAIPRDNLPVLTKQGTTDPLWSATDAWTPVTPYRVSDRREDGGAGAWAHRRSSPARVRNWRPSRASPPTSYVVNGLPLDDGFLRRPAPGATGAS